jgi:2-C-methyl-D-erythritol 4-phosphate cytidylyltransferase
MNTALIVAAGKGTRMGENTDKLFIDLGGRPVIAHTWQRFDSVEKISEIVVVVRAGMEAHFHDLAKEYRFRKPFRLVPGGRERQDSVWNGLEALSRDCEIVAIQDGARPCTPEQTIMDTIVAARELGAAVAAQRVTDTIKQSRDGRTISSHLQRDLLWAVQTPQTFQVSIIRRALEAVRSKGVTVTDDTAACELIGQVVTLVECRAPNPKITVPGDVPYIHELMNRQNTNR